MKEGRWYAEGRYYRSAVHGRRTDGKGRRGLQRTANTTGQRPTGEGRMGRGGGACRGRSVLPGSGPRAKDGWGGEEGPAEDGHTGQRSARVKGRAKDVDCTERGPSESDGGQTVCLLTKDTTVPLNPLEHLRLPAFSSLLGHAASHCRCSRDGFQFGTDADSAPE